MAYFPFFIDIKNKKCLVIGGGTVACRKIEALLEFEANITVIALKVCQEVKAMQDRIRLILREYRDTDLDNAFFVIAATNDTLLNSAIAKACLERNILINAVDELENCSFLFPAYIKQGNITVGITTSGSSPLLAGHIKRSLREAIPDYYEELVNILGGYRKSIKERIGDTGKRSAALRELTELGIHKQGLITAEDVDRIIERQAVLGREANLEEDH
jgi:siroheme synthase-like protein